MISLLTRLSNWKFILPFFLLTAYFIYLFQSGQSQINTIAGEEFEALDVRHQYTLEEVTYMFEKVKPEGRSIIQQLTGVTDMIFPFIYGPLLILILAAIGKRVFGKDSKWLYLSLLPILIMIIDYFENTNTLAMLDAFPEITNAMARKGSSFTQTKQMIIILVNGLILLGSLTWLIQWIRNRNK